MWSFRAIYADTPYSTTPACADRHKKRTHCSRRVWICFRFLRIPISILMGIFCAFLAWECNPRQENVDMFFFVHDGMQYISMYCKTNECKIRRQSTFVPSSIRTFSSHSRFCQPPSFWAATNYNQRRNILKHQRIDDLHTKLRQLQNQTERADGLEQGAAVVLGIVDPNIVPWIMKKFTRFAASTISRTIIKAYVSTFSFSQVAANGARTFAFLPNLPWGRLFDFCFAVAVGLRYHTAFFVVCACIVFDLKAPSALSTLKALGDSYLNSPNTKTAAMANEQQSRTLHGCQFPVSRTIHTGTWWKCSKRTCGDVGSECQKSCDLAVLRSWL